MSSPPVHRTIGNPEQRLTLHFLKTSVETGGKYTLLEGRMDPGGVLDWHVHRSFEKTFEIKAGQLTVETEKQTVRLYQGDRFVALRHRRHRISNTSDRPCLFHCWILPGESGFEAAAQISYGLARDGRTRNGRPTDLRILGLLLDLSNLKPPGWSGLFEGFWRWQARRARKAGLDRELYRQYVLIK